MTGPFYLLLDLSMLIVHFLPIAIENDGAIYAVHIFSSLFFKSIKCKIVILLGFNDYWVEYKL